jgi:hypothetical protein
MITLYMLINVFSIMMHAPPHRLFDILSRVSTLNIIQRKLEKLIMPDILTSFCM